jgi:competence protein ComEC
MISPKVLNFLNFATSLFMSPGKSYSMMTMSLAASRGIGYLCEQPTSVSEVGRASSLAVAFERAIFSVRERFVGVMEDILPSGEAALSLGVLIGADDGFSSAEKTLFVRTGVSHVTAVSGYNITLVGMLLFFLAIVFGWYRRGASVVAIIGIAVYVILVGAPASAVRAGIMGALLLFSFAIGRPGSGFRIWFFSLALMLAFDPLLIRYDIGFQLSYLATLALLLYAGVRETFWMPRIWIVRILYEGMVLSLFVEWLVVPVILIQFGTLSGVSILANTFIVPLVPIIMATSFFAALAGFVIPGGAFFLNGLAFSFAHLFLAGAEFLSGLPGSFFSDLSVSPALVVLWYVVTGYAFYIFSNSADHKGRSLGSLLRTDLYDREKSMKL